MVEESGLRVGVVIVNFNAGRHLELCLERLMAQSRPADCILVIDNASQDGSMAAVSRFAGVESHGNAENLGFAAACNQGIERLASMQFDLVALLNPDAYPESGWLEALLDAAARHPDSASFASRMMCQENPELVDGLGDAYHMSGYAWRRGHGHPYRPEREELEVFGACAGAALYRVEAIIRAGGFDPDFFCYCEDVDLAFRLRLAGHRCRLVEQAVVHHVGSATTGYRSDFSVYHGHRNIEWAWLKNLPGPLLLLSLPVHLFAVAAALMVLIRRGQGGVLMRAKLDSLRRFRAVWRQRREVQRRRVVSVGDLWRVIDKSMLPINWWRP